MLTKVYRAGHGLGSPPSAAPSCPLPLYSQGSRHSDLFQFFKPTKLPLTSGLLHKLLPLPGMPTHPFRLGPEPHHFLRETLPGLPNWVRPLDGTMSPPPWRSSEAWPLGLLD